MFLRRRTLLLAPLAGAVAFHDAHAQPDQAVWQRFAAVAPNPKGRPTIAFLLDDLGLNRTQSARATALPGPLTLSWMPYALNLADQIAAATARGHETMLHMPMEALGRTDPGPNALRTWSTQPTTLPACAPPSMPFPAPLASTSTKAASLPCLSR